MRAGLGGAIGLVVAMGCSLWGCAGLSLGSRDRVEMGVEGPYRPRRLASLRWRLPLATLTDLDARSRDRAVPVIDASTARVIVGGMDGAVHAIRLSDHGEVWRFQALGSVEGEMVQVGRELYFGADDGALYSVSADTGQMRWRVATNAEVVRAPVVTERTVYFVNGEDTVLAVDRANGEGRWRVHRDPPGGITSSGHSGLVLHGRCLYAGFSDGRVQCLDPEDGSVRWERDTSTDDEQVEGANEAHRTIDVDTTPVLLGDTLYAASITAGLYALDPESGNVRWRAESVRDVYALSTDGRDLFAASATRGLSRIDPTDGHTLWARSFGGGAIGQPTPWGPLLIVPVSDQSMWLLRASDGEVLEGLGAEGTNAAPAIFGRWMFFVSVRGTLNAWFFEPRG
ncbi:MAG: PQQ-binding-like beta-propeller repeat protein [Myxococcales bacterium]|nr:PQQ-binding-like beta-propeller repeat protein [Myxococcales bacterium]